MKHLQTHVQRKQLGMASASQDSSNKHKPLRTLRLRESEEQQQQHVGCKNSTEFATVSKQKKEVYTKEVWKCRRTAYINFQAVALVPASASGAGVRTVAAANSASTSGREADAKNVVEEASAKVLLPSTSNREARARNVAAAAYAKGKNALLA